MMDDRQNTKEAAGGQAPAAGAPGAASDVQATIAADDVTRQLQEWQAKAEDYLDKYRRSVAEFANYRKRLERERDQERQRMRMDTFALILPVADDLQRAVSHMTEEEMRTAWGEGVALIERKLAKIMGDAGVVPIDALGKPFDPHYHSAVMRQESDEYPEGLVVSVLQQGYLLDDVVLRPAMVAVSSGPGPANAGHETKSTSRNEE